MLLLVGTGISYDDISVRALEACKGCELYIDGYTSIINDEKLAAISKLLGRTPKFLERGDLEENVKQLVGRAKSKDVALLTGGDPLTATTHKIIIIEAAKQGVEVKIFHASSIFTAAMGESGLDFYRFGQVCTIPRWSKSYKPVSFYETIMKNMSNNLHSLVLLDYDPKEMETLSLKEAADELRAAESHYKKGILNQQTKIFVMRNISLKDQTINITDLEGLKRIKDGGMATLIFPARLSEIEEEAAMSMVK